VLICLLLVQCSGLVGGGWYGANRGLEITGFAVFGGGWALEWEEGVGGEGERVQ
jgi:hypothetical protein